MIKAVIFDIDGTLKSKKDKKILSSTKRSIEKLKEQGIYVGIATGRHLLEIENENLLEDIDFDFYITLNGGLCYLKDQLIYQNNFSSEISHLIIEKAEKYQIPLFLLEEKDMYMNFVNEDVIISQQAIHSPIPPIKPVYTDHLFYQMCAYCSEETLQVINDIPGLTLTKWQPHAFDIVPQNQSKMRGIQAVLHYLPISLQEIMVFGDDDNDKEMLMNCGIGVAMGDGSHRAKESANYITTSSHEEGIYHALKHFNII